jgi:hypothetical protein
MCGCPGVVLVHPDNLQARALHSRSYRALERPQLSCRTLGTAGSTRNPRWRMNSHKTLGHEPGS